MLKAIKGYLSDIFQSERNAALFSFNLNKVRAYLMRVHGWKLEDFPSDYDLEIAMYMSAAETPTFKYRDRQQEARTWLIQHTGCDYDWLRGLSKDTLSDLLLDSPCEE